MGRRLTYPFANFRQQWRTERRAGSEDATTYRLIVRGELDQRFAYLFEPMRCERAAGTTVISGTVIDRAHLYGLIERIEELGLELLSLEQTSEP